VILFGAQARRNAGADSDIDLQVELDDDAAFEWLSAKAVHTARSGYRGAVGVRRGLSKADEDRAAAQRPAARPPMQRRVQIGAPHPA
jgi:hypothetical protein